MAADHWSVLSVHEFICAERKLPDDFFFLERGRRDFMFEAVFFFNHHTFICACYFSCCFCFSSVFTFRGFFFFCFIHLPLLIPSLLFWPICALFCRLYLIWFWFDSFFGGWGGLNVSCLLIMRWGREKYFYSPGLPFFHVRNDPRLQEDLSSFSPQFLTNPEFKCKTRVLEMKHTHTCLNNGS